MDFPLIQRLIFGCLFPLMIVQAIWVRLTVPQLGEAKGQREGAAGSGKRLRILGDAPLQIVEGLRARDLKGHALMVHEGGDNYSDEPKPLGGGGARVACGVIE